MGRSVGGVGTVMAIYLLIERPSCRQCSGILKSDTISFGQTLVTEIIQRAFDVAQNAELFIAAGTTLQVYPVAGLVPAAKSAGARVVILNAEPTPFDNIADAVIREPLSEVAPRICGCPL